MNRIFKIEFKKYIYSPSIVIFLLIPLLLYFVVATIINSVYAMSFVIFSQVVLISFLVYGIRIRDYYNETMKKKINNSHINVWKIIFVSTILALAFLMISLVIPMTITILTNYNIEYLYENQFYLFNNIQDMFGNQLYSDMLLFNSNFQTWFQFLFAFSLIVASMFALAHLVSTKTKSNSIYVSLIIIIPIIIILMSSPLTKEIYLMGENQYTSRINIVQNELANAIKYVNPFFWLNQLLMSTIIADVGSGNLVAGSELIPEWSTQTAMFFPSYYNIFHFGTSLEDFVFTPDSNLSRTVNIAYVEYKQIIMLLYPVSFSTTILAITVLGEI